MAHGAIVIMDEENIVPVLDRVTFGAGPRVDLAQVGWTNRHRMLRRTASGAVVMTAKVSRMTGDTFALLTTTHTVIGGAFKGAIGRIVAGGAAKCGMNLTCANKRWRRICDVCVVAADTVVRRMGD